MKRIMTNACEPSAGTLGACSSGQRNTLKISSENASATAPEITNATTQKTNTERNSSRCSRNDISPPDSDSPSRSRADVSEISSVSSSFIRPRSRDFFSEKKCAQRTPR